MARKKIYIESNKYIWAVSKMHKQIGNMLVKL